MTLENMDKNPIQPTQQINAIMQSTKAIAYSLFVSLDRQYLSLNTLSEPSEYIQPFPSNSQPKLSWFWHLKLKQEDNSTHQSLDLQLEKIQSVLSAFHNNEHNDLIFLVSRKEGNNALYIGSSRCKDNNFGEDLKYFIESHFPEISCESPDFNENKELCQTLFENMKYVTALTGIPSPNNRLRVNPISQLLKSNNKGDFMYMVIAEPMTELEVNDIIYTLNELKTQLSFLKQEITFGQTLINSISQEISEKQTEARTKEDRVSKSSSFELGLDFGKLADTLLSSFTPIEFVAHILKLYSDDKKTLITAKAGIGRSQMQSTIDSQKFEKIMAETMKSDNNRIQELKQVYTDAQVHYIETLIDQYLKRFEQTISLGCWNVGIYFVAENPEIANHEGQLLKGLLNGRKNRFEPLRLHNLQEVLHKSHEFLSGDVEKYGVLDCLENFKQPNLVFIDPTDQETDPKQKKYFENPLGSAFSGLTTPLNTEELSMLINLY